MLSPSRFISSAQTSSRYVLLYFSPIWFSWTLLMAYSKAKLESRGDKASPCFRPFWMGKLSDKCLPIWTLLYIKFKHILISLTSFMGTPNSYENTVQYFPPNRIIGFPQVYKELMYCLIVLPFPSPQYLTTAKDLTVVDLLC
jgi:hypothetical protein